MTGRKAIKGKSPKITKALPGVLVIGENDHTRQVVMWLQEQGWPSRQMDRTVKALKHHSGLSEQIALIFLDGSQRSALRFMRELNLAAPGIAKILLTDPDAHLDSRDFINHGGIDHLTEAPLTRRRLVNILERMQELLEARRVALTSEPKERELLTELRRQRTELEKRMKQRANELSKANQQLRKAVKEIEEKNRALTSLNESLKIQSTTDPLTGLYNRREFLTRIRQEWGRYRRYSRPLSLIMLDIDHFKSINDTYGHECGDFVLTELGRLVLQHKRAQDLCCRYGGEEFIVLLTETSLESAFHVAEGLRLLVAGNKFVHKSIEMEVRISLGVSGVIEQEPKDVEAFINMADMAMYEAKNHGRNKTVVIDSKRPKVIIRQTPSRVGRRGLES